MSSNVHLTTLSLLREWLHYNKTLRTWRVIGMTVLFCALGAAILFTRNVAWSYAISDTTVDDPYAFYSFDKRGIGFGIPARCFWARTPGGVNVDAPLSIILLVISYIWKLGQLYDSSRLWLRRLLRSIPQRFLEKVATRLLEAKRRSTLRGSHIQAGCASLGYRVVMLVYVSAVAWVEVVESFAATLWLLTLGLAWGTFQILLPRTQAPSAVVSADSSWGFGQLLPLLFQGLFRLVVAADF